MSAIQNRYEFVYFFDVTNGNPNGDPDAGNMPRLDPESSKGLVTDVCLKRKIRNFVEISSENEAGYEIYVKEKSVLNLQNKRAYEALGIESEAKKLPKDEAKARDITAWMCKNFFDIRTFGAVMTTEVNSGQVRGPVQLAFAQSIDPIVPLEVSITRMAVTNEKDLEKERTMGRKYIVPYALYRVHGFISANLAAKTVSEGALWYMQTRHRVPIVFSDDLRAQTLATIVAVRELLGSGLTPPPDYGKRCKACSLVEICQPELLGSWIGV